MVFTSLDFVLFLLPVLAVYWAMAGRPVARTLLLIGASYFFYMGSGKTSNGSLPLPWYYVGLLGVSTVSNFVCAKKIHQLAPDSDPSRKSANLATRARKRWLVLALVINLGILAYFKYTNFCVEAFTDIANQFGAGFVAPHLQMVLPIGISFFTFQSLSYTIDVWRGQLDPEPSFRKFALFVAFFPQLVAGPIVRARELLPQLHSRPTLTKGSVGAGTFLIAKGMFKKVVFGDWLPSVFSDIVFSQPDSYTSLENLVALYAFTLQIYGDFSGYSDVAIGIALLMGFKFPDNFDRPYQATHVGDFWRRWHMTLSSWLRDYLFFPLGGSRGSSFRTYFNLWLTMFLVGMWHKASWNFIIYANMHGLAMLFNRWCRVRLGAANKLKGSKQYTIGRRVGSLLGALVMATVVGAAMYSLSYYTLHLSLPACDQVGIGSGLVTLFIVWMPNNGRWYQTMVHVLLMFHFTVLTRIFFLASDFGAAKKISQKITDWDGHGFRPGLFRVKSWVEAAEAAPASLSSALGWVGEYGVLLVMVIGIAYHFTPRDWVETNLKNRFCKLPAVAMGLVLAIIGALLVNLLQGGPRANIYFAF